MITNHTRMQSLGNTFIVIDSLDQPFDMSREDIFALAQAKPGCDQVLVLEKPTAKGADFHYRIFNADGREVAQCGNGARCVGWYLHERGLHGESSVTLSTIAGTIELIVHSAAHVEANLGVPRFQPDEIPFEAERQASSYALCIGSVCYEIMALSIGNPHAVLRVDDVAEAPVASLGAKFSKHARFPEEANVEFMQVNGPDSIALRVYERGVGETQACGSGACAAVIAGHERGWLAEEVEVSLPGGELRVRWAGAGSPVWLIGPVEFSE